MRTFENIYKVVVSGNAWVGKTCLVGRYVDSKFIADTKTTIGVDFALKNMKTEQEDTAKEITLQLWDFAGEERFKQVLPLYTNGTQGIIFCFDATRSETLQSMPSWMKIFHAGRVRPVVSLCATKCDLDKKKNIDQQLVQEMIKKYDIKTYYETSSLTGYNVDKLFRETTNNLLAARVN